MYQQITIIGNLGRDPEMRYTTDGTPVTSFSVAVNRSWTDQDGQRQDKTTWFRVSAWRRQAETCNQYLRKGLRVLVVGDLEEPYIYTDQDGNPRASLQVTARHVRFLSTRAEADALAGGAPADTDGGPPGSDGGGGGPEDIPF